MLRIRRNYIIEELLSQGKTATEIAKSLGVSHKTIYNVIKKKNTPSVSLAESIARFFGKKIENLFEFEEEKQNKKA